MVPPKTQKTRRVLTPARREQNRNAQRVFREKRKRLKSQQTGTAGGSTDAAQRTDRTHLTAADDISFDDVASIGEVFEFNLSGCDSNLGSHGIVHQPSQQESSVSYLEAFPELSLEQYARVTQQPAEPGEILFTDGNGASDSLLSMPAYDQQAPFKQDHLAKSVRQVPGSSELPSPTPASLAPDAENIIATDAHSSLKKLEKEVIEISQLSKGIMHGRLTLQDIMEVGAESLPPEDGPNSPRSLLRRFTYYPAFRHILVPPISSSDLYRGNLRVHSYSLLVACLQNAAIIGVDILAMIPNCDARFPSPFHSMLKSLGGSRQLEVARSAFTNVSRDLQPCIRQYEDYHEIYMDLFPLPKFRERILALRTLDSDIFDEGELVKDLDSNGLVCWGTPWDKRSWEARPWFLRKWWMLLSSKEDQIVDNSRWFWEQRGERHDLSRSGLRSWA